LPAAPRPAVLLVEDNTQVLDTLSRWLEQHGFAVWPAGGGSQALELLPGGAALDVALVDVQMPGMGGPATLAALQALRPGLACCLMGGNLSEAEHERLRAAGAACVLDKPLLLRDLAQTLRGLLPAG
jgi:CheY-like chemotaxis protein